MIYIVSLNVLILSLVVVFLRAVRFKLSDVIINPITLFICCFSFIYFFVPILLELFGFHRFQSDYNIDAKLASILYLFLFFLTTIFFYCLLGGELKRQTYFAYQKVDKLELNSLVVLLLLLFFVSASVFFRYISAFNLSDFLVNRIVLLKGFGYLSIGLTFVYYYLFLFFYIKRRKSVAEILIMIFCTCLAFLIFIYMGSRFSIFICSLYILAGILLKKKGTISNKLKYRGAIIVVCFTAILSVYGAYRGQLTNLTVKTLKTNVDFNDVVTSQVFTVWGNVDYLYWLMDHPFKVKYAYGETFLAGFLNLVPRDVWPDKPLGGGPRLKNMISPGSYNINDENISSVTTGLPIESYMNFGWTSILLIPPLYALILIGLRRLYRFSSGDAIFVLLSIHLIFSFCFFLLFGEFLGIIARTLAGIPLFLIPKILVIRKRLSTIKL